MGLGRKEKKVWVDGVVLHPPCISPRSGNPVNEVSWVNRAAYHYSELPVCLPRSTRGQDITTRHHRVHHPDFWHLNCHHHRTFAPMVPDTDLSVSSLSTMTWTLTFEHALSTLGEGETMSEKEFHFSFTSFGAMTSIDTLQRQQMWQLFLCYGPIPSWSLQQLLVGDT